MEDLDCDVLQNDDLDMKMFAAIAVKPCLTRTYIIFTQDDCMNSQPPLANATPNF
jgi:hypothetical protein